MICETFGAHPLGSDRVSIEGVSSETFGGEPLTSEGVSAIKKAHSNMNGLDLFTNRLLIKTGLLLFGNHFKRKLNNHVSVKSYRGVVFS